MDLSNGLSTGSWHLGHRVVTQWTFEKRLRSWRKFMVVRRTTNSSFEPSSPNLCGYYFSSQLTDPLFSLKRSPSARMKIRTAGINWSQAQGGNCRYLFCQSTSKRHLKNQKIPGKTFYRHHLLDFRSLVFAVISELKKAKRFTRWSENVAGKMSPNKQIKKPWMCSVPL